MIVLFVLNVFLVTPFHIQIYNKLNIVAITVVVAIIKLRY